MILTWVEAQFFIYSTAIPEMQRRGLFHYSHLFNHHYHRPHEHHYHVKNQQGMNKDLLTLGSNL